MVGKAKVSPTLRAALRIPWRRARLAALALLVLAATTGCSTGAFLRLGMPEPITKEGEEILSLWQGSWIAAFAIGGLVWGLMLWIVIFHRKKSDRLPPQVRYNLPIEALYTTVPFIMVSVLFYLTVQTGNEIRDISQNPQLVVNVTGFQWSWKFQYPEQNVTVIGQPVQNAENGPHLVIPVDRKVRFNLRSADVVHSMWIPAFLFKRDLIPGHPNHFAITATEQGTFVGRCSELCGTYHSRMLFTLEVVSQREFQQFIENQRNQQAQARPVTGSTQ